MAVSRINEAGLNVNQYGNRNIIYNGAMQVAQRGTSTTGIGSGGGYFTCDRWYVAPTGDGRLTMTQESDGPDGFANSIKLDCTTADTSIGASDLLILRQQFEGQDLQRFAKGTSGAKEFTVSFYVKGNAAATYTAELYDNDNTRQISKTFSVTTAWTRVELTYPADTTGAFDDDINLSLYLQLWLHAGSTFTSGTLNSSSWAAVTSANRVSSSGTSFFDSTARTFFLTGVQLEVGDTATDFEHRSYGDELLRCMRYCQNLSAITNNPYLANAAVHSSTVMTAIINLGVQMRTTPTITLSGTASNYSTYEKATARTATAYSSNGFGASGGGINFTVASGLTVGSAAGVYINSGADTKSIIEAEL